MPNTENNASSPAMVVYPLVAKLLHLPPQLALGIKTSFAQLARAGWRPFVLLLVETLWMAGLVLAAILLA